MKTNFNDKEAQKAFNKSQKDFDKTDLVNVIDSEQKLEATFSKADKLKTYFKDFKLLFSMLKDYYNGTYKEVPWNVIASIGGVLLYVLTPIDFIPDFIPMVGYLDDATVFAFCLKFIKKDIDKYRIWKDNL